MRKQEYSVRLSSEGRALCLGMVRKGHAPARVVNRAHMLLLADDGAFDQEIAASLHVSVSTVGRTRKRFSEGGLDAALYDRPHPGAQRKLDGKQSAFLMALACSDPPDGRERWTLHLLADKMVELQVVDTLSYETVRRELKRGT